MEKIGYRAAGRMMWLRHAGERSEERRSELGADLVASDHVDEQRYAINSLPSLWA
jgi:hypothetical protein